MDSQDCASILPKNFIFQKNHERKVATFSMFLTLKFIGRSRFGDCVQNKSNNFWLRKQTLLKGLNFFSPRLHIKYHQQVSDNVNSSENRDIIYWKETSAYSQCRRFRDYRWEKWKNKCSNDRGKRNFGFVLNWNFWLINSWFSCTRLCHISSISICISCILLSVNRWRCWSFKIQINSCSVVVI